MNGRTAFAAKIWPVPAQLALTKEGLEAPEKGLLQLDYEAPEAPYHSTIRCMH